MAGRADRFPRVEPQSGWSMSRRTWLMSAASLLAGAAIVGTSRSGGAAQSSADLVIEKFSPDGKSLGTVHVPKVVMSDADWKKKLSDSLTYEVTRHEDTERPFTGSLLENHKTGIYTCICCDTALFDSATKFESGTGWPSFYQPIAKTNVHEISDRTFGMVRTAVACARCESHLGHVFDDGPKPTGLRYCMNSVSLKFVPRA